MTHCPVDLEYADFLLHADGWPAILQDIDQLGTADFGTAAYVEAEDFFRGMIAENHAEADSLA